MPAKIARRSLLAAPMLALPVLADDTPSRLADLERRNGGRLGVAALDTASDRRTGHRLDELFPLCSTFKFLAAALVLARVDRGEEKLDRRIVYSGKDLITYSPVTKEHVGPGGMTLAEICEAAVTLSDNTAGNLMLASFGGPSGFTSYMRSLGDGITRLDRIETELNEATPGDPRDTTSPAAMLGHDAAPADRQRPVGALARSPDQLAARQQDGSQTAASRPAGRLARGRQDRHRRLWNRQRRGHRLADGPVADPDRGLLHRVDDLRRSAQCRHRRGRPPGRRGTR